MGMRRSPITCGWQAIRSALTHSTNIPPWRARRLITCRASQELFARGKRPQSLPPFLSAGLQLNRLTCQDVSAYIVVAMNPFKTFPVITATAAVLLSATLVWSQAPAGSGRRGGGGGLQVDAEHPVMKIGTHIPDFTLPGADGKMHSLKEWNSAKFLMIVFECNHCPESQNYESRIKSLYDDYKGKGIQLVTINPNDPASVRLDELGYTDLEDSLPEMKGRMADRHITWPYHYDGETQAISTKYGVIATPHVYIFDHELQLR